MLNEYVPGPRTSVMPETVMTSVCPPLTKTGAGLGIPETLQLPPPLPLPVSGSALISPITRTREGAGRSTPADAPQEKNVVLSGSQEKEALSARPPKPPSVADGTFPSVDSLTSAAVRLSLRTSALASDSFLTLLPPTEPSWMS